MSVALNAVVADDRLAQMAAAAIRKRSWNQGVKVCVSQDSGLWNVLVTCDNGPSGRNLKGLVHSFWYGFCAAYTALND